MAGIFSIGEKKIRPGAYHRYENYGNSQGAGATNGIGAGLIRSDWGPINQVVELDVSSDPVTLFGVGQTVDLISELFNGGCGKVLAVRIGSGGTAGSIKLSDGSESAVEVVELTAKYVGKRPFSITVRDSIINEDRRECIIYDETKEFEKVEFAKGSGEPASLVAAFSSSKNFIAKKLADGDGTLKTVAQAPITVGTNPTSVTADYSTGLNALEAVKWNVVCVDTEDAAVHALVSAFVDRIEKSGKFPLACVAETKSVEIEERMNHAAAFNSEKMHYVLNPAYDIAGNLYDGYKLAARIGGMIAAVESNTSLTHEVITGLSDLAEPMTNSQIEKALGKGCICLTMNANGQVWIESAINTLVTPSGSQDEGWKKIRRTKTRYELMDRIVATTDPLIGKVNNDSDGRAAIIAQAQGVINAMIAEKKLLEGSNVYEDKTNPAMGDSAWFVLEVDDIDSIEKVYLTFRFRFSPEN